MVRRSPPPGTGWRDGFGAAPVLNLNLALDLMVCGVLAAGLTALACALHPGVPAWAVAVILTGGALCFLWGILGRWGRSFPTAAMTTLAVMATVCGIQVVQVWQAGGSGSSRARLCATVMWVLTVCFSGTLLNLAHRRAGRAVPGPGSGG